MWYILTQNGFHVGTYLSYNFACEQYTLLTKQYPNDHIKLVFSMPTKTNVIADSKEINKLLEEMKGV